MTESDLFERIREAISADIRAISDLVVSLTQRVATLERGEQSTSKDIARLEGKVDSMESRLLHGFEEVRKTLGDIQRAMSERRGMERSAGFAADFVKVFLGGAAVWILEKIFVH